MASPTIEQIVEQIRHAIFGKDVRENIALGIEKCYEDVSENTLHTTDIVNNLNQTTAGKVLDARQGKNLNDKIAQSLNGYGTMITTAAQLSEITGGTKSINDFPLNTIQLIGSSGIGLLNYPAECNSSVATIITFSFSSDRRSGIVQLYIDKNNKSAMRFKTNPDTAYTDWKIIADESYVNNKLADIDCLFANEFNSASTYQAGDYVIYNDLLYQFIRNHNGAWNSNDVTVVNNTFYEVKHVENSLKAFEGNNAIHISKTLASSDAHIDFRDIKLYKNVQYGVYVTENVPTSNKINFYVFGDSNNYIGLEKGWNLFTPNIDGTLRLYNGNAHYEGTLTIDISNTSLFVSSQKANISTAVGLSTLTKGTKSVNDFPTNSIVSVIADGLGMTGIPTPGHPNSSIGTYLTFNGSGSQTSSIKAQVFVSKYGELMIRQYYGTSWTPWRNCLTTLKSYVTREAWLEDYPSDKLSYLPQMSVVCIASTVVNPEDAPYSNFTGTIMTVGYRSNTYYAEPGDFQIAFSLGDSIFYRRYIFASGGNYWGEWFMARGEKTYHVGVNQPYTSLTGLLYQLKNDSSKKQIIIHEGTYDIFAEYKAEIAAGHMEEPPDDVVTSDYLQYSIFVPNNTRIIGWGNVYLDMTPDAEDVTIGESYMWSPLNISGNVEIENVTVRGHNCRYCMHNDDHGNVPNAHQHYKNCRFIYTWSDTKNGTRLGYNNTIGFGLANNSTHTFDDCEIVFDGPGNHSAYYGHENNSGKNGALILRNCIIRATDFTNRRVIRLQTLGTTIGLVRAFFENCYVNGGLELDLYNESARNNFQTTFVNCNKVPVFRNNSRAPSGVAIVDPYTVRWFNPLPTPTAQDPQYESDSYSG